MICLDSTCIIDYFKGRKEAVGIVEKYEDEIVTTQVNLFEIFYGIYSRDNFEKEEKDAEEFFSSIEILPLDEGCGKSAAKILAGLDKKGQKIEVNDCLIAGIILKNGLNKIITRNKNHFGRIEGLEVIDY